MHVEAPLSDKSRQGAIEASPATDGRGPGGVIKIGSIGKSHKS